MNSYTKEQITAARRLLANPYAFMEYLEQETPHETNQYQQAAAPTIATPEQVSDSRKRLQDPYAHLDENGRLTGTKAATPDTLDQPDERASPSAASNAQNLVHFQTPATSASKPSDREIEQLVEKLKRSLWSQKEILWHGEVPPDPINLLDPAIALKLCGYSLEYVTGIAPHVSNNVKMETAGIIDNEKKHVVISEQLDPPYRRFTAAHELGHAVLHGATLGAMHRDRPIDGSESGRPAVERAADKFASLFLMPKKLVFQLFLNRFKQSELSISDENAFFLGFLNSDELRAKLPDRRAFAKLIATTSEFQGFHFKSIASEFRVSDTAMAIRLEELDLINYQ